MLMQIVTLTKDYNMVAPEKQEIFNMVADIIATSLHIEKERVHIDSTLEDFGVDSLSMVEIILKLEEQFNIEIDDEKAEQLVNVREVVDYIYSLKDL